MNNKKNKRSSHPVMFFIYLIIIIVVLSGIAGALNFQVTYDKLTTIAGEVETTTTAVNSLLSLDGIRFMIASAYDNLVSFVPFASLLIAAISFGIALKSGFLRAVCFKLTKKLPKALVVFIYSLFCIVSSLDGNLGYVLLLPLGAVLYMTMNRNAIGGLALGFASISAGHGAGLFATALDYNLSSYTEASAKLLDAEYAVSQTSNLIFIIVASLFIAGICTFISERFVVRKLGRNQIEEQEELMLDEKTEKQGLISALVVTVVMLIPIVLMLIPSEKDGFIGLLLDKSQLTYSKMIFSSDALLMSNLVGITSFILAVQGFVFGVMAGTIKKIRDMVHFSTDYLKSIGGIFVLVYFAAQLTAMVKETNLGIVITGTLSNLIGASEFSFIPLLILLFVFTMVSNVLFPTSVSKWAIIAPNIMTTAMKANVTPEFAQVIFRAGDSITNSLTPIFPYFVIFIGFIEVYTHNKAEFSIRNCYKVILPFVIGIALIWLFLIIAFHVIGIPIGPGVYPSL